MAGFLTRTQQARARETERGIGRDARSFVSLLCNAVFAAASYETDLRTLAQGVDIWVRIWHHRILI